MDLAQSFDDVVEIAARAKDARSGMTELIRYLSATAGEFIAPLQAVDISEDVSQVSQQLEQLVRTEPPRNTLNAFYFGLFDAVDETGAERLGYYIEGVDRYVPEDPDTLCDPAWWPEGRYLRSHALDAVKMAELAAAQAARPDTKEFLGYAGQLGTALIVTRFAATKLGAGSRCVVGFDSGDVTEISVAG